LAKKKLLSWPRNGNHLCHQQQIYGILNKTFLRTQFTVPDNSGATRGDIYPGRSTVGAPNWRRNVTYQVRNVKCQRMLILAVYKMSNVIAKSHEDHQGLQSEQLW